MQLLTSRTPFHPMEELATSWDHQPFKDERENITQNIALKKNLPFFFLMNKSPHSLQSKFTFRKVTTFSIDLNIDYVEILIKIRD